MLLSECGVEFSFWNVYRSWTSKNRQTKTKERKNE